MPMTDEYQPYLRAMEDAVMRSPGDTSSETRSAVAARVMELAGQPAPSGRRLPPGLDEFVDKIARNSHLIEDEDVAGLKQQGYSEDAILEIIQVAATAAGMARLAFARQAMGWETMRKATPVLLRFGYKSYVG